ncbi:transcriptional regulator with XRE-family HTH domain [Mucilaginibacter sp. UYP25]|uniref:helix-turn-helix domain-containing protein n=1 Tax=unclassified Mucilaginibacter TaxID=2617802 RepID=UPI003394D284
MKNYKDTSFLKNFGENLSRLRLVKGLSYRKMAQNCMIDHADIKKYEKGETNLSLLTLKELAKGLNIEAKELLEF